MGIELLVQIAQALCGDLSKFGASRSLPRIVDDKLVEPVQRRRQIVDGLLIGFEKSRIVGEEKAACASLRALHQNEDLVDLVAHRKRVVNPLVLGARLRNEPKRPDGEQRREHGCDKQAPVEKKKRFW